MEFTMSFYAIYAVNNECYCRNQDTGNKAYEYQGYAEGYSDVHNQQAPFSIAIIVAQNIRNGNSQSDVFGTLSLI